jgi:hypothetical protein
MTNNLDQQPLTRRQARELCDALLGHLMNCGYPQAEVALRQFSARLDSILGTPPPAAAPRARTD